MRRLFSSFYARLSTIFLLLILALGAGCIMIAFSSASHLFDDVEQLLNREYARSIVEELRPLVADGFSEERVKGAIHYMMVLNPMVEIYLLDARGKILAYFLNPAERIVRSSVDLAPVRAFVGNAGRTSILGEDPRNLSRVKPFSAAPLPMGGENGYVYIILGGERYDASLRMIRDSYYLRTGLVAFFLAIAATLIAGLSLFFFLTRRLSTLTSAVRGFEQGDLERRVEARGSDELGVLGRTFNEMASTIAADVEKLRLAERMRRDLIGNISHDLRSPLASIQGYLETMVMKDAQLSSEERLRFLEISLRNTASLQNLVEELDVEPSGDLPLVSCDVGMIERVLTNLIDNALRFTPEEGAVHVLLKPEQETVRVTVVDTGVGITPEDLPHVFERFYRADKSRDRATGGAGLGLAIARQIVELHGSSLTVQSTPGQGARFSFTLATP